MSTKTIACTALLAATMACGAAPAQTYTQGELTFTTALPAVIANGTTAIDPTAFTNFDGLGDTSTGGARVQTVYGPDGNSYTGATMVVSKGTTAGVSYNTTLHTEYDLNYSTLQMFFGGLFDEANQTGQTLTFYRGGTAVGSIDLRQYGTVTTKSASLYAEYLNVNVSGGFDRIVAAIPNAVGYTIQANLLTQSATTQNLGVQSTYGSEVPEPPNVAGFTIAGMIGIGCAGARRRVRRT